MTSPKSSGDSSTRISPATDVPKLTERQVDVLAYVMGTVMERGWPPTHREVADHLGISSTHAIACHFDALEAKGYIRRSPHRSTGMTVLRWPDGKACYLCYQTCSLPESHA